MMKKILAVLLMTALLMAVCAPALAEYKINSTEEWEREKGKYSTLNIGSRGRAVENLQWRLVELGYMRAEDVDGIYGQQTHSAVYTFQLNNWLTGADGTAYAYTQYKLYDKFAVPTWGFEMDLPVDETSSSIEIERVERRLRDTGYLLSDEQVDGVFDADTAIAILVFGIVNDIEEPDIVADQEMAQLLFSYDMHSCEPEVLLEVLEMMQDME